MKTAFTLKQLKKWHKNPYAYINPISRKIRLAQKEIQCRLDYNISRKIYIGLKKKKAGKHWKTLVNYTLKDLMIHLEKKFDKSMNWNNYGSYWSLDHIKPRCLFHFQTSEDKEFKKCWALKNLQPLEKVANKIKGNRYK